MNQLVRYNPDWEKKWDDFVAASVNGTILHTRRFLSYHPADRFSDFSLIITDSGRIRAVFAAAEKQIDGKRYLFSHPGSSYGGPVLSADYDLENVFDYIKLIAEFAKKEGFEAVAMRPAERIFHKTLAEELDFALSKSGFGYFSRELSSAIDLSPVEKNDIEYFFDKNARNAIRKAESGGVEVRESNDLASFSKILNFNLDNRHSAHPTHTLAEMEALARLFPDNIKLFSAHLPDGKMIAGVWVWKCNDRAAHTFYIAQDYDHQNLRPTNMVMKEAVGWCLEQKLKYLNIGISTEERGKVINWDLFKFKESFGAHGVRRDTYELIF